MSDTLEKEPTTGFEQIRSLLDGSSSYSRIAHTLERRQRSPLCHGHNNVSGD